MEEIRVRFAPSPTGHLHIGGARTALYNWLLARKKRGKFILRIEDTDAERSTEESLAAILDGLKWLGMDWDEGPDREGPYGPYLQSRRLPLYREQIQKLLKEGKAYQCFCAEEELAAKKEEARQKKETYRYDRACASLPEEEVQKRLEQKKPHVVRLRTEGAADIAFEDLIKGTITIPAQTLDDFIILRSDGNPVYNFAVVIDDVLMKINYVIRGDDHISNTPRQILIYRSLGHPLPRFAHVPMILGEDRTRLSKRHGATSVQQYRDAGYLPEAMINYLVRLGWSYDDKQEIFAPDELIEKFSLEKVSGNAAVFSVKKLEWLNEHYIQKMDLAGRTRAVLPFLIKANIVSAQEAEKRLDYLTRIVGIAGSRLKTLADIVQYSDFFFLEKIIPEAEAVEKVLKKTDTPAICQKLHDALKESPSWEKEALLKELDRVCEAAGLKRKDFFQVLRVALTGRINSPDLMDIMTLLGKEKTLARLKDAADGAF